MPTTPRTNISTLDTASRALLLQQLAQARRVSSCPLCAEPRQRVTTTTETLLLCPRCGDVETIPNPEGDPTR